MIFYHFNNKNLSLCFCKYQFQLILKNKIENKNMIFVNNK